MSLQSWSTVLALPLALLAAWRWRPGNALARRLADIAGRAGARPALAVALGFAAGCAASALPTLVFGVPIPRAHDEFCYLVQAQTFAAGRLTNPTPPLAEHFESPHLLLRPTYTGKYPPAQAAVLAAGLAAAGSAAAGVWLQVGLFGAALVWMLRAWLPSRWALATALVATVWIGAASYWGYSYWGGCVPAAAGAVVMGAARRLARRPKWGDGAMLGLGLVGLASSRPFEGALLGLVAMGWLLWRWLAAARPLGEVLAAGAATVLVLVSGAALLLVYDRAVTGDPFLLPYVLYERTSDPTPIFVWQAPLAVPASQHAELERYWQLAYAEWQSQRGVAGWLRSSWVVVRRLVDFYLGPALWLALLAVRPRSSAPRLAIAVALAVLAGVLSIAGFVPHYFSPATAAVAVLVAIGLRRLRLWSWHGRAIGARIAAGALAASLGVLPIALLRLGEARRDGWGRHRVAVAERLGSLPGEDLALVSFGPGLIDPGWVYNDADLERSPVVWARTIGAAEDCALRAAFPLRRVWRVELRDLGEPPRVVAEPAAACAAATRE